MLGLITLLMKSNLALDIPNRSDLHVDKLPTGGGGGNGGGGGGGGGGTGGGFESGVYHIV